MTIKDSKFYGDDIISPGYIESTASSTRKSKEDIRFNSLIPSEILEGAEGIKKLLKAYYTFLNLDEFIYQENETFSDVILDNKAVFRIPDPNNENDEFFTDEQGTDSTLTVQIVTGPTAGEIITVPIDTTNISISNGNNLPGSLSTLTSEVGKTFQVSFINQPTVTDSEGTAHLVNGLTATLITPVKYWIGPGPSHILNNIETAMDIDKNAQNYLELMQKEIAAVIPRDITVNKRNLYKTIIDYYKVRGTSDSIEIFFRLLFNDRVEVERPYDKTLIPSSGNWDINPSLPKGGAYLDHKGFLSYDIKIHDSLRYQRFSYLIKTGQNVSTWENVFNRLVHPAGFKFFGEILLLIELTKAILGEDTQEGDTLVRKVLSAMPERQPGAIGLEDIPLLVEMFASVFLPDVEAKVHKSAALSVTLNQSNSTVGGIPPGGVIRVDVADPGWGYSSAPTLSINGEARPGTTISNASFTVNRDPVSGRIESVTVNSPGANYLNIFVTPAANPNAGKLANIYLTGKADKNYKTAPNIIFSPPTAVDALGNPLSTNVQATAVFNLDSDGEITGTTITNVGNGYDNDPTVRIGSTASNEIRGKDIKPILILLLNHIDGMARTRIENNYINRKGNSYINGPKQYGYNETLEVLGNRTIQSTDVANINKYNVKSFIHIN